jgi:UDP-GlcNAc:undecaprenyl-phosphate/decaprenyl-phosphate GlcNAc-1-phosphate transferase
MPLYLATLVAGALCALLLTPLVRRWSLALGLVDAPGGRKVHPAPVPRVGGVAVLAAAAAAIALSRADLLPFTTTTAATPLGSLWPVLAGALLVFAIGLADDIASLGVAPKLAVQTLAASIVVGSGLLIERLTLGSTTIELGVLAYPATLLWLIVLTNAFNLIDGVDGLATGVAIIAGSACAAILVGRGHALEAMVLTALVGAAIGFLPYNFARASIFLGDGGSLLFGFVLASTAITGWQKGATALAAGVPLLLFALPLADALTALLRRASRRPTDGPPSWRRALRQIVEPDRGHIHHRLVALGWPTRRVVLVLYAITLMLSLAAVATARFE